MTDNELMHAYHIAKCDHDATKPGTCNRVDAFNRLTVAARVLATRLRINEHLTFLHK
jgi:hypothetical protein